MNSNGTEIEAITPAIGHFKAHLIDLGPRPDGKDSDPVPFEKTFEKGDTVNSHLEFFAVYEIIEGAFKGVQLPAYYEHYKFEEDYNHPGFTRFAGNFENKKATRLIQVRDWGLVHKLWNDPIPWNDVTILPELLERALDADVEVDLTIKNGYIRELLPVNVNEDDDDTPDFMKEPEEVPAKAKNGKVKSVAKSMAKVRQGKPIDDEEDDL
jgi:hypothetical protein